MVADQHLEKHFLRGYSSVNTRFKMIFWK